MNGELGGPYVYFVSFWDSVANTHRNDEISYEKEITSIEDVRVIQKIIHDKTGFPYRPGFITIVNYQLLRQQNV